MNKLLDRIKKLERKIKRLKEDIVSTQAFISAFEKLGSAPYDERPKLSSEELSEALIEYRKLQAELKGITFAQADELEFLENEEWHLSKEYPSLPLEPKHIRKEIKVTINNMRKRIKELKSQLGGGTK